jgi:hypothetical protein
LPHLPDVPASEIWIRLPVKVYFQVPSWGI